MWDKPSVTQAIARRLQEMIRSGKLKAGQKLPSQRVMSEQMNVSRPSLREALLTLETIGLVQTLPARGTYVRDPEARSAQMIWRYNDAYDLSDVFQTRLLIESELCRLAATTITPEGLSALKKAAASFESAWASGDLVAHVEADLALHLGIASVCPTSILSKIYLTVQEILKETQRHPLPNTDTGRMKQSIAEHWAIIDALEKGDPQAAETHMRNHICNTAKCAGVSF